MHSDQKKFSINFLSSPIDLLNFIVFFPLKYFTAFCKMKQNAEMRIRHKWSISSDILLDCLIPSISAFFASGTWLKLLS